MLKLRFSRQFRPPVQFGLWWAVNNLQWPNNPNAHLDFVNSPRSVMYLGCVCATAKPAAPEKRRPRPSAARLKHAGSRRRAMSGLVFHVINENDITTSQDECDAYNRRTGVK